MADTIDTRDPGQRATAEDEQALVATIGAWLAEKRHDEAAARLEATLDERPDWSMAHLLMAVTERGRGDFAAAEAAFDRAVHLDPANVGAQLERASFLHQRGRHAEAIGAIEAAIPQVPDNAAAHHLRIATLSALGEADRAFRAADEALARLPDSLDLLCLKGALQRAHGQLREAFATQQAVLAKSPDYLPGLIEAGTTLQHLGRPNEAIEYLDRALETNGDQVAALVAMGMALSDLDMQEAAFASLDRAAQLAPTDPDIALKRGLMLQRMGRTVDAIEQFERVIGLQPTNFSAHLNIGACYALRGRHADAVHWYEKARELNPSDPMAHSNILFMQLHNPAIEMAELARQHRAFGERFGSPEGRYQAWPNDLDPDRKLRIGIVSAEFCGNASNSLVLPFIEGIDRTAFALFGFSNNPTRDPVTARYERLFDGLQSIVGLDDETAAEDIRAKEIDILIDFTGHTGMNRLTLFALKPAPVQAGWIGYPFTTGLGAIDYSVMDSVAVRPGEEVHFVETVVRLDGTRFCIEPPAIDLRVSAPPSLRQGWITFGSFNRMNKITDEVLHIWCRILKAVPGSRLRLKDSTLLEAGGDLDRVQHILADHAIDLGRLEVRGRSDYAAFLHEHAEIDIALDPFPFSGASTSVDALWMGLPIVTLPGAQPVSRQAETFLTALGRRDWVAADADDYVRIAARLAADPLRLADLRLAQRTEMLQSRLCDKHLAARDIERAWRWMWHRYVASRTSA